MPAVEKIADPDTLAAFHGMLNVANTAKWGGAAANVGLAGVPGFHGVGAGAALVASFNPRHSGPGLVWKLLQSPNTRSLLSKAGSLPSGSPELEAIAAQLAGVAAEYNPDREYLKSKLKPGEWRSPDEAMNP